MTSRTIGILIAVTLALASAWGPHADAKVAPSAGKGVMDLSSWDFKRDGPVDLSGEYAVYWNELLDFGNILNNLVLKPSGYIQVPGYFHDLDQKNTGGYTQGYATYHLKILLNDDSLNRLLAIKYQDMGTAFNLSLNGQPLVAVGTVGQSPQTSKPRYQPGVSEFGVNSSSLDLVMQVSNYHHRRGGAWGNLTLGSATDLRALHDKRINLDVFLFGSIFIMAIYHLGMYLLRRNELSPLFFSVFCLLVGLRLLTTGERYIMEMVPALNWQLLSKLEYLSFYLSVPAFTQFVHHLFPKRFSKRICALIGIIGMLFSLAVIVLPVALFSHTLPGYQLFTLAVFGYAITVLVKASLQKEIEAILFLTGFLLIFLASINDILLNENIIQTRELVPLGLFLFIFIQAFLQSMRFSRTFKIVERQRQELRETNGAYKREIADRTQVEIELKKSQERFLLVLDSIAADVYVADMETYEILFMNKNMVDAFDDDLTGQICWKAFRDDSGPCAHCTNDKLVDDKGEPSGVEIWECQNPLTSRWYINYDRAVKWEGGKVVRLQVATDVTDRKLAEETLREAKEDLERRVNERTAEIMAANEKLHLEIEDRKRAEANTAQAKSEAEKANKAKSEFLANMSHELRTPLNHIMGFTQLVLSKKLGDLNADQEEYLNDVHHSSAHLLSLINDILDISKVEAGKVELEWSDINLTRILENSLIMIKEKAMRHAIELKLDVSGTPDVICADERKLKQILYNLLSNAVKFTPDGGQLSVTAVACAQTGESDNADAFGNSPWIKIGVTDSGIGLRPEDIEHIFKPFEQVENSTSRRFQGTGLGLSLTKNLVELHGGRIWAESQGENQGSTFYFIIPLNPGTAGGRRYYPLHKTVRTDIRNVDKDTSSFFKPQFH